MKKIYLTGTYSGVTVDTETDVAEPFKENRCAISSVYLIKEPAEVIYTNGEKVERQNVEKDDIVIVFYEERFKNRLIVLKNQQWVENILEYENCLQEEKERWASEKCMKAAA